MSLNIGAILATLSLDNSGFKKGFLEANAVTSTFGQTFTTAVVSPVLGAVTLFKELGVAAAKGVGVVAKAAADLAAQTEKINNAAQRTGLSTDMVQGLDRAMIDAGESAGSFATAVDAMARKLGDAETDGGRTVEQLRKIGLTLDDFKSRNADQRFQLLFDAISGMADPFQRAAYAADFFDRTVGVRLLNNIQGGSKGLKEYIEQQKKLGTILGGDTLKAGMALDNALDGLGNTLDGLKNKLTERAVEGFVRGLGGAGDGAQNAADIIAEKLGPAIEVAAEAAGVLASNLDRALTNARQLTAMGELVAGAISAASPAGPAAGSGWFTLFQADVARANAPRNSRPPTGRGK